MFKIEEYFNTTLDNICFILKYEDPIIEEIVKKKFGTTLKGAGTSGVTLNTKKLFVYIEDIIKLDIAAITKFNGDLTKAEAFLSKADILEKLMYAYNLHMEEVVTLYKLPVKVNDIFAYAFGVNRDKMSIKDIATKYDTDEEEILSLIFMNLKQIFRSINNSKNKQTNIQVKKVVAKRKSNSLPIYFLQFFVKKGYKQSEVINALKMYDSEVKQILFKLYGKDYLNMLNSNVHILSSEEKIIGDLINGENNIENVIKKRRKSVILPEGEVLTNFNLKNYYCKLGFNEGEFFAVVFNLNDEEKRLLKKAYDSSFNIDIITVLNDAEKETLYRLCFNKNVGIYQKLIENKNNDLTVDFISDIIAYFENMGFSSEQIWKAYCSLSNSALENIKGAYNGNLKLNSHIPESDFLKKKIMNTICTPNTGFSAFLVKYYDRNKKLKKITIQESDYSKSFYSIYAFFGLKGVFSETVLEAIRYLTPEYKTAYENYYSDNGLLRTSSKKIDITLDDLYAKVAWTINNLEKLKEEKNIRDYDNTIGASIEALSSFGFSKDTIKLTLKTLTKSELDEVIKYATGIKKSSLEKREAALLKFILNANILANACDLKGLFSSLGFSEESLNKFDDIKLLLSNVGEMKNIEFMTDIMNGSINIYELDEDKTVLLVYLIKKISEYLIAYENDKIENSKLEYYKDIYDYFNALKSLDAISSYKVSNEFNKNEVSYYYLTSFTKNNYLRTINPTFMNISCLIYLKSIKEGLDEFLKRYAKYGDANEKLIRKLKKIG